jgi:hypothetical protein
MSYASSRRTVLLGAAFAAVLMGALVVTVETHTTPTTPVRPGATSNNSNSHDFKLAALGPINRQKKHVRT